MTPAQAIEVLKSHGLTEVAIAARVGTRQSTINKVRHGLMSPSYLLGKALVDLAGSAQTSNRKTKSAA